MAIAARYLSHILVYGGHSDYGGGEVMELDELMRLRLYAKSNGNKVISKEVFLRALDSHIRLSIASDDKLSIREKKMSYNERQALKNALPFEQVRLPPNMEEVRKAYNL